jgi:hypothetical protein
MTDGIRAFRNIQFGKESTRGDAIAADTRLLGTLTFRPDDEWHTPEDEERNSLALLHSHTKVARGVEATYEGRLTFQQILAMLLIGVKGGVSPASTGSTGGVKKWTFERTLTAKQNPDAITLEYGDNQQAFRSAFVTARELQWTIPMRAVATQRATLFGRSESTVSFTTGISAPSVIDVVGTKAKVYLTTSWATLTSTATPVSDLLINAMITLPTGLEPVWTADGSLDFQTVGESPTAMQAELTFLSNAQAITEYQKYRDGALRFIRIEVEGDQIEAASSVAGPWNYFVRWDMALRYTESPQFFEGEESGINTIRITGRTFEDPTSNRDFRITVQSTEASV